MKPEEMAKFVVDMSKDLIHPTSICKRQNGLSKVLLNHNALSAMLTGEAVTSNEGVNAAMFAALFQQEQQQQQQQQPAMAGVPQDAGVVWCATSCSNCALTDPCQFAMCEHSLVCA